MTNPLIEEITLPGITLTLPSMGWSYDKGMFAEGANVEELHVRPYTMWVELHSRDPFKMMDGSALNGIIKRVCPDILRPEDLASIDVDAILISARNASYGNEMEIDIKCTNPEEREKDGKIVPKCGNVSKVNINLNAVLGMYPILTDPEEWKITMENGQVVQLRPMRHKTTLSTIRSAIDVRLKTEMAEDVKDPNERIKLAEEIVKSTTDMVANNEDAAIKDMILSVSTSKGVEIRERGVIEEWVDYLPPTYTEAIMDKINELMEPINKAGTVEFECPHCGHKQDQVSVVMDPQVFFSKPSPKQPIKQKRTASSKISKAKEKSSSEA